MVPPISEDSAAISLTMLCTYLRLHISSSSLSTSNNNIWDTISKMWSRSSISFTHSTKRIPYYHDTESGPRVLQAWIWEWANVKKIDKSSTVRYNILLLHIVGYANCKLPHDLDKWSTLLVLGRHSILPQKESGVGPPL